MQDNTLRRLDIYKQIKDFIAVTKEAFDNLDRDPFLVESLTKAMEIICSNNGKLITTGLGKAGSAAEKSASSFSSLGIPACYLHPAQASHGDAGIIQHDDIMIAFSNSGKTREVIETIGMFRKLSEGSVISITSHSDSPMRELSDMVIFP
jgi:arabinose-5-phosphate isomerase